MSDEITPDPSHGAKVDEHERRTAEQWAQALGHVGPEAWKFATAKAFKQWPVGAELSRKDYDAAVQQASELSLGYSPPAEVTKSLKEWSESDYALLQRIKTYQGWSDEQPITEAQFRHATSLVRER